MIEELADLLAATLNPLVDESAISLLGGLVQTLETDKPLTANPWFLPKPGGLIRLPIARNLTITAGARSGYAAVDFVPNHKERAIVYIEDMGPARQLDTAGNKFEVRFRVVGWYDKSRDETVNLQRRVSALLGNVQSNDSFSMVTLTGRQLHPGSAALFSRYTYSQLTSQYLFPPYTCFAIDVTLTFTLKKC